MQRRQAFTQPESWPADVGVYCRIVKGHELQKLKTALAARLGRDAPHPPGVEEEAADATPRVTGLNLVQELQRTAEGHRRAEPAQWRVPHHRGHEIR